VDEAGMSPLAGPVSAAAVILKPGTRIVGVDDSKTRSCGSRRIG
jgi:ribonuclease HII